MTGALETIVKNDHFMKGLENSRDRCLEDEACERECQDVR